MKANDTYVRALNIDAEHPIPDSVFRYAEKLLSNGNTYNCEFIESVGLLTSNYSTSPALSATLPFSGDLLFKQMRNIQIVAKALLLFLKVIPVVTRKNNPHDGDREYWGCYKHSGLSKDRNVCIELYSDTMYEFCSQNKDVDFTALSVKVLIHELVHAMLDVNNYGIDDKYSDDYRKWKFPFYERNGAETSLSFYTVREESLANLITYRVIRESTIIKDSKTDSKSTSLGNEKNIFSKKYIEFVMKNQPSEYRLALYVLKTRNFYGWIDAKYYSKISYEMAEKWMNMASNYIKDIEEFKKSINFHFQWKEEEMKMPWAIPCD